MTIGKANIGPRTASPGVFGWDRDLVVVPSFSSYSLSGCTARQFRAGFSIVDGSLVLDTQKVVDAGGAADWSGGGFLDVVVGWPFEMYCDVERDRTPADSLLQFALVGLSKDGAGNISTPPGASNPEAALVFTGSDTLKAAIFSSEVSNANFNSDHAVAKMHGMVRGGGTNCRLQQVDATYTNLYTNLSAFTVRDILDVVPDEWTFEVGIVLDRESTGTQGVFKIHALELNHKSLEVR